MNLTNKYKKLIIFFLISLLFKPIWLFNNQTLGKPGNDDLSHWLHAATIVYDYDIDYMDDYEVDFGTFNKETNTPFHPPGSGYLSSPFVFLFSLFDSEEPNRLNPVGSFAYLGYFFASLFYFLLGTFFVIKTLHKKELFNKNSILIFAILTGTIAHFVTTRFVMAHSTEYFLCAALCYLYEGRANYLKRSNLLMVSIVYFLLSVTRPSTFIYSLCLLIFYLEKKDYKIKNFVNILLNFSIIGSLHIFLSMKLYNKLTIYQNYGTTLTEQGYGEVNILSIVQTTPKLVNLFLSPSMGLFWTIPVVFFGVVAILLNKNYLKEKNIISNIFLFLYIYGAMIVLIVWQGREVSFGQRLLIGLIPFFAIRIGEFIKNKNFYIAFRISTVISYVGYLYFYTSENLTLKEGKSLWGRTVGFAGEDYFIFLFKEILQFENILSFLGRTIYSVNLFSFMTLERLLNFMRLENILPKDKILSFSELTDIYLDIDKGYLLTVNLMIFIFCFTMMKFILPDRLKQLKS